MKPKELINTAQGLRTVLRFDKLYCCETTLVIDNVSRVEFRGKGTTPSGTHPNGVAPVGGGGIRAFTAGPYDNDLTRRFVTDGVMPGTGPPYQIMSADANFTAADLNGKIKAEGMASGECKIILIVNESTVNVDRDTAARTDHDLEIRHANFGLNRTRTHIRFNNGSGCSFTNGFEIAGQKPSTMNQTVYREAQAAFSIGSVQGATFENIYVHNVWGDFFSAASALPGLNAIPSRDLVATGGIYDWSGRRAIVPNGCEGFQWLRASIGHAFRGLIDIEPSASLGNHVQDIYIDECSGNCQPSWHCQLTALISRVGMRDCNWTTDNAAGGAMGLTIGGSRPRIYTVASQAAQLARGPENSQSKMLALPSVSVGTYCVRSDATFPPPGKLFRCDALPSNVAGNWTEIPWENTTANAVRLDYCLRTDTSLRYQLLELSQDVGPWKLWVGAFDTSSRFQDFDFSRNTWETGDAGGAFINCVTVDGLVIEDNAGPIDVNAYSDAIRITDCPGVSLSTIVADNPGVFLDP